MAAMVTLVIVEKTVWINLVLQFVMKWRGHVRVMMIWRQTKVMMMKRGDDGAKFKDESGGHFLLNVDMIFSITWTCFSKMCAIFFCIRWT